MTTTPPFRAVTEEERKAYDRRFRLFLMKLDDVAGYRPREKYLYPIMDGVPFNDFDVALDLAEVYEIAANNPNIVLDLG
jgi:hypothetical protein